MNSKISMHQERQYHNYDNMSLSSNTSALTSTKMRQADLICQNHQQQICCNYCVEANCFQPLCSECIEDHLVYHKKYGYSDLAIKSIRSVRKDCIVKLTKLIEELIQRLGLLETPLNPQVMIQEMEQKLQKIRNHIYEIVEQQIARVKQSLRMKVSQSMTILKGMQEIHIKLQSLIEQLKETCYVLNQGRKSQNFTVADSIKKTLTLDSVGLLQTFERQSLNYSNKHKKIDFDIFFNSQSFQNMFGDVIKVASQKHGSKDLNTSSISFNLQKSKTLKHSQLFENQNNSRILSSPQFQSPTKILHFFQTGSNKLHLIYLDTKKKKNQPKAEEKIISISEFMVPSFHASLLSQANDCIYLSGGILQLNGKSKSPLFMRYSIKTQSCKKDFSKVRPRSSHTLCEDISGEYVYILGGYGENQSLDESLAQAVYQTTVEKISTKSGKVELQAASNWGGANIAFYIKSYIVKACEEGVELYNNKSKQWVIADIKMYPEGDFIYYKNPGFTIFSENQILLYGGYQQNEQSVDKCFHWKINGEGKSIRLLINQMASRLPQAQGFYNNPGIIDKKSIYALQNIEAEQGCKDDERLLLRFDFSDMNWKQMSLSDQ